MERAGFALAARVAELAPDGLIVVVCGKGNNGGDGYVAARLLRQDGRDVRVLTTVPVEELRGDAAANAQRLPGPPPQPFAGSALADAAIIVDAILGTGFSGAPHGTAAEAIAALRETRAPVVAADVPSGVDASSGAVEGQAVRAAATVTFHASKPGLAINPGRDHAGTVHVADIGIPDGAPVDPPDVGITRAAVVRELPRRRPGSTKFTSGHVLVAGGSRGLTGAPCLASLAATRAGAGYVTACVPASLETIFEVKLTEVMTRGLPDAGGAHTQTGAAAVVAEAEKRGGALVLGCGLGRSDGAVAFARALARQAPVPLVLDADGLNAHAGRLEDLAAREHPTVLTPHAGELGRLLEIDSAAVEARRLEHARAAARRANAIVVLKGDDSLVAHPDGRVAVSEGGAPALATAGTGDVLSGVVGAYLAKGMDAFHAACAAVFVHAAAGRVAAHEIGEEGVIASDVIAALPRALPPAARR
jgi:NAD(P)H-hydrate epimerase